MNSKNTFFVHAIALAVATFAPVGAHAVDAFDPTSNLLTLDSVTMMGTTYRNVAVTVNSYSLVGVAGGSPVADTFDPASNTLVLGAVAFQGTTYNNATVKINSYTLRSAAGAGTPGTLATNTYSGEMAGYLAQLNTYRTQCGIPALSQNTVLEAAAQTLGTGGNTTSVELATAFAYVAPSTVGGIRGNYWSNSTNNTLVGQLELQTAMMDYNASLTMMRPYTDVGMVLTLGKAGSINQRGASVLFGNPVSRNTSAPVTFPCANTTDIAPYTTGNGGGLSYSGLPATALSSDGTEGPSGREGTPIVVFANPGDTLVLTNAAVTAQGGAGVPVTLITGASRTRYGYEGAVWPQQNLLPNTAYDVVIFGTVNGVAFSRSFTFRTGAAIPLFLP